MTWKENPPVVVLLAKQFNPSVLSQMWLSKNGILDPDGSYKPESIFAVNLAQAITDTFVLAVTPDQLQFLPQVDRGEQQQLILDKVGGIVRKLPHVPYHAVGLNFNWHLCLDEGEITTVSRALFAGEKSGIFARFSDPDAKFGAYLSKDHGPFRLKLDVKPVALELPEEKREERIQFSFNFHSHIPPGEGGADIALERFAQWNAVRSEAIETIRAAGYEE